MRHWRGRSSDTRIRREDSQENTDAAAAATGRLMKQVAGVSACPAMAAAMAMRGAAAQESNEDRIGWACKQTRPRTTPPRSMRRPGVAAPAPQRRRDGAGCARVQGVVRAQSGAPADAGACRAGVAGHRASAGLLRGDVPGAPRRAAALLRRRAPVESRRRFLRGAAVASAAAALAAVTLRPPLHLWPSLQDMAADHRTATGEQARRPWPATSNCCSTRRPASISRAVPARPAVTASC